MFHTCIKLFPSTQVNVCIYYISGRKWSTTHSAQIPQKQDRRNIYAIMKTMCPLDYHHNGFVVTNALWHMMTNVATVHHVPKCMICHITIVVTGRANCFHDWHIVFMRTNYSHNALENSLENNTGGFLEKIFNKNPDLVKLEFYSLQLYWKVTPTQEFF